MRAYTTSVLLILLALGLDFASTSTDSSSKQQQNVQIDLVSEVQLLRQLLNQETIIRMNMETELRRIRRRLDSEFHESCNSSHSEPTSTSGKGDIYIRWGKNHCRNDSEMIYTGQVGGSDNYKQTGAAVTHLCLPLDPIYDQYDPAINNHAYVFGAEFDIWNIDIKDTLFDKTKYTTKGVSCAVCRPYNPASVIMIPGRNQCYSGMTKEYSGYLMAGYHSHVGASEYICVDGEADIFPTAGHKWRKILYPVESMCEGPLKCPPYINGAEMTCVVCSA